MKRKNPFSLLHSTAPASLNGKSRKLIVIVWLFVAIVVLTFGLAYYSFGLLSAGRAYVGGEGLWSKAQKDMVYMLARYIRYNEESSYQEFRKSLEVIYGDRQARIELDKAQPDLQIAMDGFLKGKNHPDDIDAMIHLYRYFHRLPELAAAVDIWKRADLEIDNLVALADAIHNAAQAGPLSDTVSQQYLNRLYRINQNLKPMEDDFSYALGDATRQAHRMLMFAMFTVLALLLPLASIASRRMVRQSEAMQQLSIEAEKQLRDLMQSAPLPIVITRLTDHEVLYANDYGLEQFNIGSSAGQRFHAQQFFLLESDLHHFTRAVRDNATLHNWEVQLQDLRGVAFWALVSAQRIYYKMDLCALTAVTNITERKRMQDELRHRAFFDELTGLPNRAKFLETLDNLLTAAKQRPGASVAILFIDLDRFKIINDDLGHDVGDKLLQQVARRLKSCLRAQDSVSRLGGDEFVVLIDDCPDLNFADQVASNILKVAAADYFIAEHQVNVTISIGISLYPDNGTDSATLLKNADVAMYRAKELGRNNFQCYGNHHNLPMPGA